MTVSEEENVQEMLLDSARDFLHRAHSLKRVRAQVDSGTPLNVAIWKELGQLGWLGLRLPETHDGTGLSIGHAAELAALFGSVLLPEPFASATVGPAVLLAAAPYIARCKSLAKTLCDGSEVIAIAWQDRLGQIDPEWHGVAAEATDQGFRLHGRKLMVDACSTQWLVPVIFGEERLVLALSAANGAALRDMQRMADGGFTATLDLNGAIVDNDAVLLRGELAGTALVQALDETRLVLSAQLAGIAAGALSQSATYLAQRKQFGQPISDFQIVRHRLVDLDLQKRLAFASWRFAARVCTSSIATAKSQSASVSAAKARCSEVALAASRAAIQLHGAFGYTEEADIGLFLNATLRHASALGNAEVHRRRFTELTLLESLGS